MKRYRRTNVFAVFCALTSVFLILNGCGGGGGDDGTSSTTCPSGSLFCGNPVGGPSCCPVGDSCCFGYNLCCPEGSPHLGKRHSDGAILCYKYLNVEGTIYDTYDLLTVCGKPAN